MESQDQNPEFRNNPENFHPCTTRLSSMTPLICTANIDFLGYFHTSTAQELSAM